MNINFISLDTDRMKKKTGKEPRKINNFLFGHFVMMIINFNLVVEPRRNEKRGDSDASWKLLFI